MVLQPVRHTAERHCCPRGGLLPHLFTLTQVVYPQQKSYDPRIGPSGGYFLLHYYTLADVEPLTRTVLCVARTFLSPCGQR